VHGRCISSVVLNHWLLVLTDFGSFGVAPIYSEDEVARVLVF
jgi:hypothetical protein